MSAALIHADALHIPLADESVDLIITSPPYFALRSYRDGDEHYDGQIGSEATPQVFLEALWAATAECWRVLKPSGSLWVNLGDSYSRGSRNTCDPTGRGNEGLPTRIDITDTTPAKSLRGLPWRYAIGCIDGLAAPDGQRWILRAEVVWSKPNGLPESVTDRVRRSHEQWFHLTRSPRYFAAVDEVRESHADRRDLNGATDRADYQWSRDESGTARQWEPSGEREYNPLGKLPGSVWQIPSEPLIIPEAIQRHYDLPDHFAAFPTEWPRRIILGWSPNGVCVECGEGRRPVVAKEYRSLQATNTGGPRAAFGQSVSAPDLQPRALTQGRMDTEATITGYACACPDDSAPTMPARVLDCFAGTGTVPMVARALGRFGIGIDLSADYLRLAKWRITSGHAAKAMQRTHRENQGDLFANPPTRPTQTVETGGVT